MVQDLSRFGKGPENTVSSKHVHYMNVAGTGNRMCACTTRSRLRAPEPVVSTGDSSSGTMMPSKGSVSQRMAAAVGARRHAGPRAQAPVGLRTTRQPPDVTALGCSPCILMLTSIPANHGSPSTCTCAPSQTHLDRHHHAPPEALVHGAEAAPPDDLQHLEVGPQRVARGGVRGLAPGRSSQRVAHLRRAGTLQQPGCVRSTAGIGSQRRCRGNWHAQRGGGLTLWPAKMGEVSEKGFVYGFARDRPNGGDTWLRAFAMLVRVAVRTLC